ncbi:hypothetical protein Anapl_00321 [Anas platyrhynchos]|uniref:Uncharacterized protein n=1 Tax=Anas platyrhynchos TaxID=8839 RepID=R0KCD5_ANAPL|nr:hypothetical protein Anapl_00321 [Anas platyrhynchos]
MPHIRPAANDTLQTGNKWRRDALGTTAGTIIRWFFMCHDCADIWIAYSWSPENRLLYQTEYSFWNKSNAGAISPAPRTQVYTFIYLTIGLLGHQPTSHNHSDLRKPEQGRTILHKESRGSVLLQAAAVTVKKTLEKTGPT